MSRGPYISDDYRELYVPATGSTWPQAQHTAAEWALETGDEWSRTRFIEKRDVALHDCGAWDLGCEGECGAVPEPVYVFETYEGTFR